MSSGDLVRKFSTALRVLKQRGVRAFLRETGRKLLTVTLYRLDVIPLDLWVPNETSTEGFEVRLATRNDLNRLFATWRDPEEDLARHRRVVETYGFDRCVLVIDRASGHVAHFQFLLTIEDTEQVQRSLP